MRRTLALSIFALGASLAHAQGSVTIYGVVVQSLTGADAVGHNQASLASGSRLPSQFGLVGREDRVSRHAAVFRLENDFNLNSEPVASTTSFFNCFSFVGLDTPAGQATLGRQGGFHYDKTILYDPTYYSNLSLNASPISTFRLPNLVKYQSATYAGFNTPNLPTDSGRSLPNPTLRGTLST